MIKKLFSWEILIFAVLIFAGAGLTQMVSSNFLDFQIPSFLSSQITPSASPTTATQATPTPTP